MDDDKPTYPLMPCIECGTPTIGRIKRAPTRELLAIAEPVPYCIKCLKRHQEQFPADKG